MPTATDPCAFTLPVDRLRLPLHLPVGPLLEELDAQPEAAWVDHFVPDNYEGTWRILPLRGPAGETHPLRLATSHPGVHDYADTPFQGPAFRQVLARFPGGLGAARVMLLGPGSRIRPHTDPGLDGSDGTVRLHIPLRTHPEVAFLLNGTPVPMRAGECWCLRLSDPHAVENPGPAPRIHLVLDARLDPWLRAVLALPAEAARMLAFLEEIGLVWECAELAAGSFLPGLEIAAGRLRVDPGALRYPGDILHEAGHLAVTPAAERGRLGPEGLADPGLEIAALAWSYAAALHLGLAPEVVFHPDGYKGQADWIAATLGSGASLGQPLLAWMGLTRWQGFGADGPTYPAMARWLRA